MSLPCSSTTTEGFAAVEDDSLGPAVVGGFSVVSLALTATKVVVSVAAGTAVVGRVEVISSSGATVTGFSGTKVTYAAVS